MSNPSCNPPFDEVSSCCQEPIFSGSIRIDEHTVEEHSFCMACCMECEVVCPEQEDEND